MSSIAALRELHATIGSALDEIDRVYTKHGLAYPSLDVPTTQNAADPKKAAAEELTTDPVVANASALITAACSRLTASVINPSIAISQGIFNPHHTSALVYLEASNTVEILRSAGPQGLHAKEIARKVDELILGKEAAASPDAAHSDPIQISHVLRLLATYHWLREVEPDVFAINRLSSIIDTGKTLEQLSSEPTKKYDDSNCVAAFIAMCGDEQFHAAPAMPKWLLPSKDKAARPPTAFQLAYKTGLSYYAWLELPENAAKIPVIGRGMGFGGATEGGLRMPDKTVFPWHTLPEGATVVDVGGGVGSIAVQVASAYPHLRLVVQDRPQTVSVARKVWGTEHAELFDSGRVSFLAQDFFEPQPAALSVPGVGEVKHPAVYIITRVMHNQTDEDCIKILTRLRAAAGPDTKLVIHEIILPLACPEPAADASTEGIVDTPSPLSQTVRPPLVFPYSSSADMTMMVMMNSRERTLREFAGLARAAGWRIAAVARSDSPITWGYLTAVPV